MLQQCPVHRTLLQHLNDWTLVLQHLNSFGYLQWASWAVERSLALQPTTLIFT